MCTVSYISNSDAIFITSNRDEHSSRPASLEPKEENINGYKILYPEDPAGKGSWFAVNNTKGLCVLLNGAFEKHVRKKGYAMSRGKILLNVIATGDPIDTLRKIDLQNIEPFTLILLVKNKLFEFRWNGEEKFLKELNSDKNYIWSSTTLYSKEIRSQRENLFTQFVAHEHHKKSHEIIDFHMGDNVDDENGFVIDRKTGLKTFSITQAVIQNDMVTLNHRNLYDNKKYTNVMSWNKNLINTND